MRLDRVITEFDDYRAFVSHTLCKHRLFLGLNSPEGAQRRLRDAAVWPQVPAEVRRMLTASTSVFGVVGLEETVSFALEGSLRDLEMVREDLQEDPAAFDSLRVACEVLRDLLEEFGEPLRTRRCRVDPSAVFASLEGRDTEFFVGRVKELLVVEAMPALANLATQQTEGAYADYWPISAEICFVCRVTRVAAAIEDVPTETLSWIETTHRSLLGLERVVSCWSPGVPEANRPAFLARALADLELSSDRDAVDLVARLAHVG